MGESYSVAFENISKSHLGVQALADVSFSVKAGSCHALVGENGAGKSTLGKIKDGALQCFLSREQFDEERLLRMMAGFSAAQSA
ncbi:MAG: hypothetical protein C4341_08865 [Armatimonadota bacterium]